MDNDCRFSRLGKQRYGYNQRGQCRSVLHRAVDVRWQDNRVQDLILQILIALKASNPRNLVAALVQIQEQFEVPPLTSPLMAAPQKSTRNPTNGNSNCIPPQTLHKRESQSRDGLQAQVLEQHDPIRPHLRRVGPRCQDARQGDPENRRCRPLRRGARPKQATGAPPPPQRVLHPRNHVLHARRSRQKPRQHVQPRAS